MNNSGFIVTVPGATAPPHRLSSETPRGERWRSEKVAVRRLSHRPERGDNMDTGRSPGKSSKGTKKTVRLETKHTQGSTLGGRPDLGPSQTAVHPQEMRSVSGPHPAPLLEPLPELSSA